jgi:L-fuculose-phosphate aldolase
MWETEKKSLLKAAQQMVEKELVVGTAGNLSMRIDTSDDRKIMVITPSGCYYDVLKPKDMVIVDFNGKSIEGKLKPSIETMLHVEIYKARQQVNAVVHAHPVFSSVFAVARQKIPPILDDQIACLGGEINVADYAPSGSPEMIRNVVSALGTRNAVLMANHGALSVGATIREAITNCELLEKTAKVYVHALAIGKIIPLS